MAQNVYDNPQFFDYYSNMRKNKNNANELIEIPIFKSMLPDVKNKKILDLGCGSGDMCRFYAENGAKRVLGLDISQNMLDLANNVNKLDNIDYKLVKMEDLSSINEKFDCIFSSLAFHYIKDFDKLISDINNLLVDGGELLFSNEHPIATCLIRPDNPEFRKYIELDGKRYYLFADYNNNGERHVNWEIKNVIKYHRNFSTMANTLIKNGFVITQIQESYATKEAIELVDKYKYQKDYPYFIFIKATKTNMNK